jgi:hypothetical protein
MELNVAVLSSGPEPGVLLSAVTAKPPTWLVPGRVPLGMVTLLDGDFGLGWRRLPSGWACRSSARASVAARHATGSCHAVNSHHTSHLRELSEVWKV